MRAFRATGGGETAAWVVGFLFLYAVMVTVGTVAPARRGRRVRGRLLESLGWLALPLGSFLGPIVRAHPWSVPLMVLLFVSLLCCLGIGGWLNPQDNEGNGSERDGS